MGLTDFTTTHLTLFLEPSLADMCFECFSGIATFLFKYRIQANHSTLHVNKSDCVARTTIPVWGAKFQA